MNIEVDNFNTKLKKDGVNFRDGQALGPSSVLVPVLYNQVARTR